MGDDGNSSSVSGTGTGSETSAPDTESTSGTSSGGTSGAQNTCEPDYNAGDSDVGATTQSCHEDKPPQQSGGCPTDFKIDIPCSIIKVNGGSVVMTASDMDGYSGGQFNWSTASKKITLFNPDSSGVTVMANLVGSGLDTTPSAARDAETLTVTRKADGCKTLSKTVKLTIAKVTFSKSDNQRYGYDNNDPPTVPGTPVVDDDHVCIKTSDYTFVKVTIEGGALGTDFDFVCDNNNCTPVAPEGKAVFDLRLNAGSTTKGDSVLTAKARCTGQTVFSKLKVHVYKERLVKVVVAKIDNPNHTFLRFATADYAAHAAPANAKLKEGVVKYEITNFDPNNAITPIAYISGTGTMSYDIANGGGTDFTAIANAMTPVQANTVRVAIIREMKSYYYLTAAASAATIYEVLSTLTVNASGDGLYLTAGQTYNLGTGATMEQITIITINGSTIMCTRLKYNHAAGGPDGQIEFPAAGWGNDPILIMEGSSSLDIAKWTILHEVGHRPLGLTLLDIDDSADFMNYMQNWTDHRLRYCPRKRHYNPPGGTENQWDLIPRT